jgi:hypothetical protein
MPIVRGRDSKGTFYRWGHTHGAKYYYTPGSIRSRESAYAKAVKQAQAAFAHGYREKK